MKRFLFLLFSLLYSIIAMPSQQPIEQRTDHICRRWYLVERLTKPMDLIEQLYTKHENQLLPLQDLPVSFVVTDPLVKDCLQLLINGKSIEPVVQLWRQIRSFRNLDQETLPLDFVLFICILLRHSGIKLHLLNSHDDICQQIQTPYAQLTNLDTVHIIDLATRMTHYLKGKKFACLIQRSGEGTHPKFSEIGAKDISLRFCLVSRLKKTFDWLRILKNKKVSFFKTMLTRNATTIVVDDYITLHHSRIVLCCKEMAQTESLAPFVALWKQFKQFEEIHDVEFLKDFLKLVFVTYHYLFLGNMVQKSQVIDSLVQEMFRWSTVLNDYSLIQILEVIDLIERSCDECKFVSISTKQLKSKKGVL